MRRSSPDPAPCPPGAGQMRVARDVRDQPFQAVWEVASDAMALSDVDGIVFDANPAYYQLYGCAPAEILGQSFAVIFPAELRTHAEAQYRALFNQPDLPPTVEATVRRKDGSACRVEVRYTFLNNPTGQRTAMLSVIRDITERTQAEELRARLASRCDVVPCPSDAFRGTGCAPMMPGTDRHDG